MDLSPLPQQRLAIEAPLGPVLVVAGPGAGKTFCLIGRVDYLIDRLGFAPAEICAVTFTNKAAEEITARLKRKLGDLAEQITRGTLHSLCLRILREHVEPATLHKGFGIADEEYQRAILARLKVHPKRRGQLLALFSRRRLQNYHLTTGDEQLFQQYDAHLARLNLVDFDGLIARTANLFSVRADIARAVAGKWQYILVDEFQDLNPAQYQIIACLAADHRNVFAVGDDEQSIFSWTGADPRVLLGFRKDFGISEPIVLDRNFRCSQQIFDAARRVLARNPRLFEKRLTAERKSVHEVRAFSFPDEEAEVVWLLNDLQTDRATSKRSWGEYAILYREHRVGDYLEGRLLQAGIPCRLARGRSMTENEVVGYVLAMLRVMQVPNDPVAIEAFAGHVFPDHLLQELQAAVAGSSTQVVGIARGLARSRPASDPDTKKLWRFVYQVENLAALSRSRQSLLALVEELLSQSIGPYRNALEERHDELSDPADIPEAVRLSVRLDHAVVNDRRVLIEPNAGLGIALRGMLSAVGVHLVPQMGSTEPERAALRIGPSDVGDLGLAVTVFKALQLREARGLEAGLLNCVTFDLETTDKDPATCEIVEIGAARVVENEIVDRFRAFIRPSRPITRGATEVHGYTDADVRDASSFAQVWPEFRAFVGNDVLVAHNGQSFDVPVLRRLAAGMIGVESLVFYDTLPLARSLSRRGASLSDLASRFGIDVGRLHHALDDSVTLARVYVELQRQRTVRARKSVLVNLLDFLGLALVLETGLRPKDEHRVLLDLARLHTLGRYSDCLDFYAVEQERTPGAVSVEEVIQRLGGKGLMARLRAAPDAAQRYPAALARLRAQIDTESGATLEESIAQLLERVALSTSEGADVAPDRVNLLTLHSTKGLEFSRVFIVGVEDYQLPGYYAVIENRDDEIQEARRLLYVGMTRARDRLVLTRADRRFGLTTGGSRFVDELGVHSTRVKAEGQ